MSRTGPWCRCVGEAVCGPLLAAFVATPHLAAQDAAAWRARIAGEPAVAVRALAEVPEAMASAVALDVVELLRNGDVGVRNAAIAWLRGHPGLADAVLGRITELRRDDDIDTARAAGAVYRVMLTHRSVSIDELRGQLRDPSRWSVARETLVKAPELAFALLPELLQVLPHQDVDLLLRQLIGLDPGRVEAAIAVAIDAGGNTDALAPCLEAASADLRRHAARLDAWRPTMNSHRTGATIIALTRLVAAGLPPPPHWLDVLRRDDAFYSRQKLLSELGKGAIPATLWPELLPLLGDDQAGHQIASLLLAEGRGAVVHRDAVRAALARATSQTVGAIADLAAQLAPVTRDCAPLLLRHLTIDHAPTQQGLLLALGELGDGSPEILAAIERYAQNQDEGVRRAAVVALRQLGVRQPSGGEPVTTEQLLQEVVDAPWDRALLAEFELASRGVSPHVVWAKAVLRPKANNDWLQYRAQRGLFSDLLRRMADVPCRSAGEVAALGDGPWLAVQDQVRRLDVLARSGDAGHRLLAEWLYAGQGPRHVLEAIAAIGPQGGGLRSEVEPFVHHDQLVVRDAAMTCLMAIGGLDAVSRARALADPWPRYRRIASGSDLDELIAFVTDLAQPSQLRSQALLRLAAMARKSRPEQRRSLFDLLAAPEPQLRRVAVQACQSDPGALYLDGRRGALDPRVLQAFAGGARDVREPIGFLLRSSLGVVVTDARLAKMSRPLADADVLDASSLTQLALESMRSRDSSPALLQAMLATNHPMTDIVLRAQGQKAPAELVPQLIERLSRSGGNAEVLATALLPFPDGRAAVIRNAEKLPDARRLALLIAAGADMFEFRDEIAVQLRAAAIQSSSSKDFDAVAKLPWRTRTAELTEIAELVRQLWLQSPTRRTQLLPLIGVMGAAGDFATDDLVGMLRGGGKEAELAAEALLTLGHAEPVNGWLRELATMPVRHSTFGPALQFAMGEVVAELAAEAPDEQLPQLFAHVRDDQHLSVRARTELNLRLLALAEAQGMPAFARIGWRRGELDAAAEPAFAAFLKRRARNGGFADSLQQQVAGHLFASYPRLCLDAVRDGLVAGAVVINRCAELHDVKRIAAVGNDVLDLAARGRHTGAGEAVGQMLAHLPDPPVAKVIELLDDEEARHFALRVLLGLGPKGAPALDAVEAIAASGNDGVRFLAAKVLTTIGPGGITRLGALLRQWPELVGVLDAVLASGDAANVSSVASVLLLVPSEPNEARAGAIRSAIARLSDNKARALLTLALLRFANEGLDRDWLGVASLEPPVVRRLAVVGMRSGKCTLLQLGVLAELLDDPDAGVRAAAVEALLADPTHIAACRVPLRDYALRPDADPACVTRIDAALGVGR